MPECPGNAQVVKVQPSPSYPRASEGCSRSPEWSADSLWFVGFLFKRDVFGRYVCVSGVAAREPFVASFRELRGRALHPLGEPPRRMSQERHNRRYQQTPPTPHRRSGIRGCLCSWSGPSPYAGEDQRCASSMQQAQGSALVSEGASPKVMTFRNFLGAKLRELRFRGCPRITPRGVSSWRRSTRADEAPCLR